MSLELLPPILLFGSLAVAGIASWRLGRSLERKRAAQLGDLAAALGFAVRKTPGDKNGIQADGDLGGTRVTLRLRRVQTVVQSQNHQWTALEILVDRHNPNLRDAWIDLRGTSNHYTAWVELRRDEPRRVGPARFGPWRVPDLLEPAPSMELGFDADGPWTTTLPWLRLDRLGRLEPLVRNLYVRVAEPGVRILAPPDDFLDRPVSTIVDHLNSLLRALEPFDSSPADFVAHVDHRGEPETMRRLAAAVCLEAFPDSRAVADAVARWAVSPDPVIACMAATHLRQPDVLRRRIPQLPEEALWLAPAFEALAQLEGPAASAFLTQWFSHPDPLVSSAAIRHADPTRWERRHAGLASGHPDPTIGTLAVGRLAASDHPEREPWIWNALSGRDPAVIRAALRALATIGGPASIERIQDARPRLAGALRQEFDRTLEILGARIPDHLAGGLTLVDGPDAGALTLADPDGPPPAADTPTPPGAQTRDH